MTVPIPISHLAIERHFVMFETYNSIQRFWVICSAWISCQLHIKITAIKLVEDDVKKVKYSHNFYIYPNLSLQCLASTNQCLRFLPTFIDSTERRSTIAFLETRRIRLEFYSNLLFNRIRCTERWIRMRTKTNACWSKIISKYYLRIPSKGSGEHIFTLSLYPIPKRTPRKPDSNLN